MAFKLKGFPKINKEGYENLEDGRSPSSAFQKTAHEERQKIAVKNMKDNRRDKLSSTPTGEKREVRRYYRGLKKDIKSR
tara:strand:- start:408 stop:644 length:237 start_codon:yes stop_codon:yes gene_type:complete